MDCSLQNLTLFLLLFQPQSATDWADSSSPRKRIPETLERGLDGWNPSTGMELQ